MATDAPDLPTVHDLDELVELVEARPALYVRWSAGPHVDQGSESRDELTGASLPGLCANPLAVEAWWGDRPLRLWLARRIHDYVHLRDERPGNVRPWLLEGQEIGRGPDNEPIVKMREAVAWLSTDAVAEAAKAVHEEEGSWGPLRRREPDTVADSPAGHRS